MKIEVGKFYKTRTDKKVRIYALDGYSNNCINAPIHGAILHDKGWEAYEWFHTGRYFPGEKPNYNDIVSEWEEPRVYGQFKFPIIYDNPFNTGVLLDTNGIPAIKVKPTPITIAEYFNNVTVSSLGDVNYTPHYSRQIHKSPEPSKDYTHIPKNEGVLLTNQLDPSMNGFRSIGTIVDGKVLPTDKISVLDQKYIDAIKETIDKLYTPLTPCSGTITHSTPCSHSWKEYVGLMDRYNYCEKCDEKKNV